MTKNATSTAQGGFGPESLSQWDRNRALRMSAGEVENGEDPERVEKIEDKSFWECGNHKSVKVPMDESAKYESFSQKRGYQSIDA